MVANSSLTGFSVGSRWGLPGDHLCQFLTTESKLTALARFARETIKGGLHGKS